MSGTESREDSVRETELHDEVRAADGGEETELNGGAPAQDGGQESPAGEGSVRMRHVVSYVRREGRLTRGQSRALEDLWPEYGIPYREEMLDLQQIFGRECPVIFEIGFGMGRSFLDMAQAESSAGFLGTEVHRPGIGACLMGIRCRFLTNVRVMDHDAVEILKHMIPENSLSRIQVFFPDPWSKKKHHKRRLIQKDFLELAASRLILGGRIHMATDWQEYAESMRDTGNACPMLRNLSATGDYVPRPAERPLTKFEERGLRLGHGVWDLIFERI